MDFRWNPPSVRVLISGGALGDLGVRKMPCSPGFSFSWKFLLNHTPGVDAPGSYPSLRLRDLALGERPQERLERFGAAALSDTELLAMLLRSGCRGKIGRAHV